MKIKLNKLHPDAVVPSRASEFAGGWDVVATEVEQTGEDHVVCKLGFALELPEGYRLILVPRSNLTNHYWTQLNSPGLGDADFRGEYQIRFRAIPITTIQDNLYYQPFPYQVGDRIGQVYLEQIIPMEFEVVDGLGDTKRGVGGFGSTGK